MDSYATTSTVSEGTSSATEIDVDDADRQKALGAAYDDSAPQSQSPLSLSGVSDLDDDIIEDLKLDPRAPDSPGLRETLRQGLKGLRIESRTASGSIRHHSVLNSHHHHEHHPDSTHRHVHHLHHLKHHIRSRRSRRAAEGDPVEREGAEEQRGGGDGGIPDLGLGSPSRHKRGEGSRHKPSSQIGGEPKSSKSSTRAKVLEAWRDSKYPKEKSSKQTPKQRPQLGIVTSPRARTPRPTHKQIQPDKGLPVSDADGGGGDDGGGDGRYELTASPVEEGDDGGYELTASPTSASDPNEGVQLVDSPIDTDDDDGIQLTQSPDSDEPDEVEEKGEPIVLMDSPSSI